MTTLLYRPLRGKVFYCGFEEAYSQRYLEDSRARRERTRRNMANRLDVDRAICERGESCGG